MLAVIVVGSMSRAIFESFSDLPTAPNPDRTLIELPILASQPAQPKDSATWEACAIYLSARSENLRCFSLLWTAVGRSDADVEELVLAGSARREAL